jgi:chromosome segregation ATPase
MEFLDDYSEEDAKCIMATLQVVQSRGWSPKTDDQYQFHIILVSAIRCYELKIEQLEKDLEKTVDEANQKLKDFKDIKDELRLEREINEELVDNLKRTDEEIKHLKKSVQNRDDIVNGLEEVLTERTNDIENLKENCETHVAQLGKKLILEQKLKIQNGVIKELKSQIKDSDKKTDGDKPEEIKTLMDEIEQLENENEQKENRLKKVNDENAIMQEKLKFLDENKKGVDR